MKLLERVGWRKLGARLRLNDKGNLEYQVPVIFNNQRPPIIFHHVPYSISIDEHSLASRLPKASTSPQIVARGDDFVSLMRRSGDPECLDDYISTDRPMLGLHIVSFADATLITLSWSYALLDGMGRKALLDAWSLMLQGREDEILPLHGVQTDPLIMLGQHPMQPYKHVDKRMSTWQLIVFGVRFVCDQMFWRPKDEGRVICVPAAYVQALRNAALNDIDNERKTFGLRWLLSRDLLHASSASIGNALTYVPAFMSASDVLTRPLGHVAATIRKALVELSTREQIEARMALDRISQDTNGNPALFGDQWMHMVVCTNWTKGNFYELDLSAAVVRKGNHLGGQKLGRPLYIQLHAFAKGFSLISGFSIRRGELLALFCAEARILGKVPANACSLVEPEPCLPAPSRSEARSKVPRYG
ncbi:MAG: hypothetical protein Q9195_006067 [Heterodermia aff. obscurata]